MKTIKTSFAAGPSSRIAGLMIGLSICLMSAGELCGQHYMTRGDAAPGLTAQKKLLEKPELAGYVQPVQIFTPEGSLVSMWSSQGFASPHDSVTTVGLAIGQVYRLQVSHIHRYFDREVYPSIEVIDRLYPPQGMEGQFPIQIVITQDDLEKAIQGRLVTKVIYLEDGDLALPYRPVRDDQPYFDIGKTEDPMRTAERMGRPMAIIRIGSRVPTFDDFTTGEFDFSSAPVFELPHPQQQIPQFEVAPPAPKEIEIEGSIDVGQLIPHEPEPNLPPIIRGESMRRKPDIKR